MCNNSGQLFVHMFVYCSSQSTVHVWNTSVKRTTSTRFRKYKYKQSTSALFVYTHVESITQNNTLKKHVLLCIIALKQYYSTY